MPPHDLARARPFADRPDPRVDRTTTPTLGDLLVIAGCATIAGADSWEETQRFGRATHAWRGTSLARPDGIPSHDTSDRVGARLDPERFAGAVARWMGAVGEATGRRPIAIDGTAVRAAPGDPFRGGLHPVNARAAANRRVPGQEPAAAGSHAIAAVPELLKALALKGAPVTPDAAGGQEEVAGRVRDGGGDHLRAVKGDRPSRHEAVLGAFGRAIAADFAGVTRDGHEPVEDGHGRHEERSVTVIDDPDGRPPEWPDGAAVVRAGRERTVKGG